VRRFRTLRWQLTLSYFVAVFAALMTLEGVFVIIPTLAQSTSSNRPAALLRGLDQLAPQVALFVNATPPDRAGVIAWLHGRTEPVANIASGVAIDSARSIAVTPGQNALLVVTDAGGQTLAALAPDGASAADVAGLQQTPQARAALAAALAGKHGDASLLQVTPDGRTVVAATIRGGGGSVRGALLLGVNLPALRHAAVVTGLFTLLISVIPFVTLASVVGAIAGLLTARGLTRRLSRLTTAARAWSQGDFAASASDSSPDELGQLAQNLDRMAGQLRVLLLDRQQLAVIEERNRLARDLHDSVKQQIFATTMQVAAARSLVQSDPAAAEARLGDVERLVGEAQRELTALIHALRPVALGDKGLARALRYYCADWSRRCGIAVEVRIQGECETPLETEDALFRVTQEALSNIARHSGATRAAAQVCWGPQGLTLTIGDNGRGFDAASEESGGVGLHSMQERVAAIGGALSIRHVANGPGMEIEVWAPLTQLATPLPVTVVAPVGSATTGSEV
ncbi:MAG: histidine kinase, partial [Ktedonobacterales bacterium]